MVLEEVEYSRKMVLEIVCVLEHSSVVIEWCYTLSGC